jgi:hypothetical protein
MSFQLRNGPEASGSSHEQLHFRIGGVSVALDGFAAFPSYLSSQFMEPASRVSETDVHINVGWADTLQGCSHGKAFNSGGVWSLFHKPPDLVFDFSSPVVGPHPYKRLCVDQSFCRAELTLSREALGHRRHVNPLEYPADELLFTNYLACHGIGVEVHGCGLVDPDAGGFLFLGHSGAGKSTTTRLWKSIRKPEILSDDRIILRIHEGELWMYGTPWHGEAAFASPGKARIDRLFILQHGPGNSMVELSRARAVGELFARCFPPFHSARGLTNTLEFLHRVVNLVPCHEFHFVPDASAVEDALAFRD